MTDQEMISLVRKVASQGMSKADRLLFVAAMQDEHRTLQQAFTRLCVTWLEVLASSDYDDRNEASVKLGRAFVANLTGQQRSLPVI